MSGKDQLEAVIITLVIIITAICISLLMVKLSSRRENKILNEKIAQKKEQGFYPVFSEFGVYFVKFQKGLYGDNASLGVRCFSDDGLIDACITIDLSHWNIYPSNQKCAFMNPYKCEFTNDNFLITNNIATPTGRWADVPGLGVMKEFEFNI